MKITLEKWKSYDYKEFFEASNDEELYANMSDTFPKTLDECRQIVCCFSESTDTTEYIRAIKTEGKIIGCIAAFFEKDLYCKNAEIAYWINSNYRGKGIMSKAIQIFSQDLFFVFDIQRIWARPFEHNKASQRVLQKLGFNFEGVLKQNVYKNDVFLNSVVYALLKQ